MESKRARLDRYLAKALQIPRKQVRLLLMSGKVEVDGLLAKDMDLLIDEFNTISCDGRVLQACSPKYFMVHKPVGVVSATKDDEHKTVLELLPEAERSGLHIVGRLDLNTSGLLLLTNDSRWSEALMQPGAHVSKEYLVTLGNPLTEEYAPAFAAGMYFSFEDITTAPARLEVLDSHIARVVLTEGKYHQIKRMFGRFRNPVVALHRSRVGGLSLDENLAPGHWRALTRDEVQQALRDIGS
ncbi:16S rRNA pseudouridine(516) synthase [Shewanella submarina]|uniref:Pseudouridine synthase n=1 Tax=Shewanella submarina TaxID=2016376 RepID=A0ABV7GJX5_9GAMM|nr:pseudouridine synthase [Shewanella submarina]MCL1036155.1 16S rRNA pseudouridine(516) synthase [Shewanella submarina]